MTIASDAWKVRSMQEANGFDKQSWIYVWGDIRRVGGTEARMMAAANVMAEMGHSVVSIVRSPHHDSPVARIIIRDSEETYFVTSWLDLLRKLGDLEAQVIWTFGLKQSLVVRFAKPFLSPNSILVMPRNGLDYGWSRGNFIVDSLSQKLVNLYIANSRRVSDHLIAVGLKAHRVRKVLSGISDDWRDERVSRVTTDFIMVGNSRPEKNHDMGVQAFLNSGIDANLTIYTDDGEPLRRLLSQYEPSQRDRIKIVEGERVSKKQYDLAAVLLHPSTSESLPLTVLEATARGCYVVAGRTGDIEDVVGRAYGVVVDATDLGQIQAGIEYAYGVITGPGYKRCFADHKSVRDYTNELLSIFNELQAVRL